MSKRSRTDEQPASGRRGDGLLTTGDMARLTNSTLRTVRFYEEAGLIEPGQRSGGGHRLFPRQELRKLRLVSDLRAAGFSLGDIRQLLQAKHQRTGAARRLLSHLDAHLKSMRRRAVLLQRLVSELEATRALLWQCSRCEAEEPFAAGCMRCEALREAAELAPMASVLWHAAPPGGAPR